MGLTNRRVWVAAGWVFLAALASACSTNAPTLGDATGCDPDYPDVGCQHLAVGWACTADLECASGRCDGACQAPVLATGSCLADADCASGYCDSAPGAGTCGPEPVGYVCTRNAECGSGLCTEAGLCALKNGAFCKAAADCASDVCDASAPGARGVCRGPEALFAACYQSAACASSTCCGATGGHEGACCDGLDAPCSSDTDCADSALTHGLRLECVRAICRAPLADGAGCARDVECVSSLCVDGTCGAQRNGNACSVDGDCTSGFCGAGACAAKQADGAPCSGPSACVAARCVDGTCGPQADGSGCASDSDCKSGFCDAGACSARLADGASCAGDDACASGLCYAGVCQQRVANGGACNGNVECVSGMCAAGLCSCIGPESETTTPNACCSGAATEYSACDDPNPLVNPGQCVDGNELLVCCDPGGGVPDGNYGCTPSDGMACTSSVQCDPGLACGDTGVCCALPGKGPVGCCSHLVAGGACACAPTGNACQVADECCSGSCVAGVCG